MAAHTGHQGHAGFQPNARKLLQCWVPISLQKLRLASDRLGTHLRLQGPTRNHFAGSHKGRDKAPREEERSSKHQMESRTDGGRCPYVAFPNFFSLSGLQGVSQLRQGHADNQASDLGRFLSSPELKQLRSETEDFRTTPMKHITYDKDNPCLRQVGTIPDNIGTPYDTAYCTPACLPHSTLF